MIKKRIRTLIQFINKYNQTIILYILLPLTIIGGSIYTVYLGNELRFLTDEVDYYTLAQNLATSGRYTLDGTTLTAYYPPGWTFFLVVPGLLSTSIIPMRILNFVLLAITMYGLAEIVRTQASALAGMLAAALVLAYPVLFFTAGTLYPQTLGGCLFVMALYVVLVHKHTPVTFGLAGLLFGLLILTIPLFAAILVVLSIVLVFEFKVKLRDIVALLAATICVLIPWLIRNKVVLDTWVPVSTNTGINLLIGNSEYTGPNTGYQQEYFDPIQDYARQHYDEVGQNSYYRDRALTFIRENPLQSLGLYVLKVLNYFNVSNELMTTSQSMRWRTVVMLVTYGPLLVLALIRLALFRRMALSHFELLCVLLYLAGALIMAVFFTRIRFRLPFDYLLIGFVAIFLGKMFTNLTECTNKQEQT